MNICKHVVLALDATSVETVNQATSIFKVRLTFSFQELNWIFSKSKSYLKIFIQNSDAVFKIRCLDINKAMEFQLKNSEITSVNQAFGPKKKVGINNYLTQLKTLASLAARIFT